MRRTLCQTWIVPLDDGRVPWACWKTYVGRPEADQVRSLAMTELGLGLSAVGNHEESLSVKEAELSTLRRLGMPEESIFIAQSNLATTYARLGRFEESTSMARDVYLGNVKLFGKHHRDTLFEANNYAWALVDISRFEEAKSLLRKTVPVARRILGEDHRVTLKMRWVNAKALYEEDRRHARRSPRGRDDARGGGTDRASRTWRRASAHNGH